MALLAGGFGTVIEERRAPLAVVSIDPEVGVIGSVVRLDGTRSLDPLDKPLTYVWDFLSTPIGSRVVQEGFRLGNPDSSIVTFSPDLTGEYVVALTVSNGMFASKATGKTLLRAILIPDGTGLIPDGKFIWSYIRDIWQQAENRQVFETLWSALIQIVGSELLKTYQADFNKSIRDIQDTAQRRWLCYEPRLDIDTAGMTGFVGNQMAGLNASSEILGSVGKAVAVVRAGGAATDLLVVEGTVIAEAKSPLRILYSLDEKNVGPYDLIGPTAAQTGYRLATLLPNSAADLLQTHLRPTFSFQSTIWNLGVASSRAYALIMSSWSAAQDQLLPTYQPMSTASVQLGGIVPGDVLIIEAGINAGLYRIVQISGSYVEVDRSPPGESVGLDDTTAYRPVGYSIPASGKSLTNTLAVPYSGATKALAKLAPGRIIGVGGRGYTVLRTYVDPSQGTALLVVSTDGGEIVAWRSEMAWRVPHCLVSAAQNFEVLGVRAGDLLVFDVTFGTQGKVAELRVRVVAVDRYRVGFILATSAPEAGVVPGPPEQMFSEMCAALGIAGAAYSGTTGLTVSGRAAVLWGYLNSLLFQTQYWNRELTLEQGIVTPLGTFYAHPRYIIRNSTIPVDSTLVEIPAIQEWIKPPGVSYRDGKYYIERNGQEYEVPEPPLTLKGNVDYIIDSDTPLDDTFVYKPGSDVLEIEGGRFVDRHVASGDILTIDDPPGVAGAYTISTVIDQDRLRLAKAIPQGTLALYTSRLSIKRRLGGTYLRFVPGSFDAAHPLPKRLWAEVSYFDNSQAIEDNFGILVGLRRRDLDTLTKSLNYRQAVSGLMYAYSSGTSLERIRLGAQILLGLPFTENRGIIRSVDQDFRLDVHGDPELGRIVVEDIDNTDAPLGTQRIYTFPIDVASDLAGLETSPVTGKVYAVGDIVELFAPLAKGVRVSDYRSDPLTFGSAEARLQQFHSYRLKINDIIFGLDEIGLVSEFLRRITPAYVAFILSNTTEVVDELVLEDQIYFALRNGLLALADNIGSGLSSTFRFDDQDYSGHLLGYWGTGMVTRRVSGQATTTLYSNTITVAVGGLLVTNETDGAPCRVGDSFRFLEGPYAGPYTITGLTDTTVTVDGPSVGFGHNGVYPFIITRQVGAELRRGAIVSASSELVAPAGPPLSWRATSSFVVESGLGADGVMPGDWMVVEVGGAAERFVVTSVDLTVTADNVVRVRPADTGILGGNAYRIYRPSFLPSPFGTAVLHSNGTAYTTISDPYLHALMDQNDDLEGAAGVSTLKVLDSKNLGIVPVLPAGDYTVSLRKPFRSATPGSFIWNANFNIHDQLVVTLTGIGALVAADGTVTLGADYTNPRQGDFLEFPSGVNADVNVGYGPGILPIIAINPGAQTVKVAATLTVEAGAVWRLSRWLFEQP